MKFRGNFHMIQKGGGWGFYAQNGWSSIMTGLGVSMGLRNAGK